MHIGYDFGIRGKSVIAVFEKDDKGIFNLISLSDNSIIEGKYEVINEPKQLTKEIDNEERK